MPVQTTHTLESLNEELEHFRNVLKRRHSERRLLDIRIEEIAEIIFNIRRDILELELKEKQNADQ